MHCTLVDEAIGRILDALAATGRADNTVVVFTADHGDTDGAHNRFDKGAYFYEEVWRIPLTIAMPGVAPAEQSAAAFSTFAQNSYLLESLSIATALS